MSSFDRTVIDTFAQKLELNLPAVASLQSFLPVGFAGLGFRASHLYADAAFWSAGIATFFDVRDIVDIHREDGEHFQFEHDMQTALDSLVADGNPTAPEEKAVLPASVHDICSFYEHATLIPTRLQAKLSVSINKSRANTLRNACSDQDTARLISCSGRGASAWLTNPIWMPDYAFKFAIRLRLGLPLSDNLPITCPTCDYPLNTDPAHIIACRKAVGLNKSWRHVIRDFLVGCLHRAGIRAVTEALYYNDAMPVPDIDVTFPCYDTELVDVRLTTPTCGSYVALGQSSLGVASFHERRKERDYKSEVDRLHISFTPFVLETFGAIADKASAFIDRIVDNAVDAAPTLFSRDAFRSDIVNELSITLQIGNANVIRKMLKRHFV